jgi:hypothetical protein
MSTVTRLSISGLMLGDSASVHHNGSLARLIHAECVDTFSTYIRQHEHDARFTDFQWHNSDAGICGFGLPVNAVPADLRDFES